MKKFRYATIFLALIVSYHLTGCTQKPNHIWFEGPINRENAQMLISWLKNNESITTLYISSGGGDSNAGLELGQYIQSHEIRVIVVGACHSACANYIFLPAKQKGAAPWASIGMHGGYSSNLEYLTAELGTVPDELKLAAKDLIKSTKQQENKESTLLKSAGIDPKIINESAKKTYYGSISLKQELPDRSYSEFLIPAKKLTAYELWFPDITQHKRWGIEIMPSKSTPIPLKVYIRFSNFRRSVPVSNEP